MTGPVWRFAAEAKSTCDVCLREAHGLYLEGVVTDNSLTPLRRVCTDCYRDAANLVVSGEAGSRQPSPAYARQP